MRKRLIGSDKCGGYQGKHCTEESTLTGGMPSTWYVVSTTAQRSSTVPGQNGFSTFLMKDLGFPTYLK